MIIGISGKINSGKDVSGALMQYKNVSSSNTSRADFLSFSEARRGVISSTEIRRFADEVKNIVCRWTNCTRRELENSEFKNTDLGNSWAKWKVFRTKANEKTFTSLKDAKNYASTFNNARIVEQRMDRRKLMQLIGTDAGRNVIHPDLWVNIVMSKYIPEDELWCNDWIMPDVRKPNEAQAILNRGGIIIRIERDVELRHSLHWARYIKETDSYLSERSFISWCKKEFPEFHDRITHESETALDDFTGFHSKVYNNNTIDYLNQELKKIQI